MDKIFKLSVIVVFLMFGATAHAKKFTSQYCEFELPSGWECALEGSEWVCQSNNKDRKREAIIIFAAKIRGKSDDLPAYQEYLKKTKTFVLPGGQTQVSEPKYTKVLRVKDHSWIDSMHLASEVPGFFTRYLATVKEDLGVAVTLSVAKDHYAAYQPLFDQIVKTLRVFRQKNLNLNKYKLAGKKNDGSMIDDTTFINTDNQDFATSGQKKGGKAGSSDSSDLIFILVGLAVVGFVVYRLKKGKGKGKAKGKDKKKKKSKSKEEKSE